MAIEKIYLGIWFPRTSIHLKEIYRFLRYKETLSLLNDVAAEGYWKNLDVLEADYYEGEYFDFLTAKTKDVKTVFTEDGVIVNEISVGWDVKKELSQLHDFYIKKLSPALSFLFSQGAPIPKDLTRISETHPAYLVGKDLNDKNVFDLLKIFDDHILSRTSDSKLDIFNGEKITIINIKKKIKKEEDYLNELIQNLVFFREFEKQLANYLHIHRTIWEKISVIRDSQSLYFKDVKKSRDELLDILETLSFVKARLRQMRDILKGRERSIDEDLKKHLISLGCERFSLYSSDVDYIENLWQSTIDYANSALGLINSVFEENTQKELNALRFLTLLGVIVGFFGMNVAFPWEETWNGAAWSMWSVLAFMVVFSLISFSLIRFFIYNRRFSLHKKKEKVVSKSEEEQNESKE